MARPLSDQQRQWLTTALAQWSAEGLITAEQSQRILESYETPEALGQRKRRLASLVLTGVGCALVGLAVLLIATHNWDTIRDGWNSLSIGVRLAAIFLSLGASQSVAVLLWRRPHRRPASEAVFVFTSLLYGAAIVLVAEVFHLSGHWPDAMFWWAVGLLPVALCLDSLGVHVVLTCVLAIWAGGEVIGFPYHSTLFGLLPNGAYSLLPMVALGLMWSYRRGSTWGANLYVLLLGWWIVVQAFSWGEHVWRSEAAGIYFIAITAPVLLILAENHRRGNPLARPYHVVGGLLALGALVPTTFHDFHRYRSWWYGDAARYEALASTLAVLAVVAVLAALLLLIRPWTAEEARRGPFDRLLEVVRRHWAPLTVSLGAIVMAFWWLASPEEWPLVPTLLGNALVVLLGVWLLGVGLREERGGVFSWGVCCLLVWAVTRYIEVFVEHSSEAAVFGAAALLGVCGAALFGLATLWRHRKSFVRAEPAAARPQPAGAAGDVFRFASDGDRFVGPPWLDAAATWLGQRRGKLLGAAAILQLVVLLAMTSLAAAPLLVGQTVRLAVTEVVPTYRSTTTARLEFAAAAIPPEGIDGGPSAGSSPAWENRHDGRTVFVTLTPDPQNDLWHAAQVSFRRPTGGVYLQGRLHDRYGSRRIEFGAEEVDLPAGSPGTTYHPSRKVTAVAEVAVAPWGSARVRDVIFGPPVPR